MGSYILEVSIRTGREAGIVEGEEKGLINSAGYALLTIKFVIHTGNAIRVAGVAVMVSGIFIEAYRTINHTRRIEGIKICFIDSSYHTLLAIILVFLARNAIYAAGVTLVISIIFVISSWAVSEA